MQCSDTTCVQQVLRMVFCRKDFRCKKSNRKGRGKRRGTEHDVDVTVHIQPLKTLICIRRLKKRLKKTKYDSFLFECIRNLNPDLTRITTLFFISPLYDFSTPPHTPTPYLDNAATQLDDISWGKCHIFVLLIRFHSSIFSSSN